MYSVAGFRSFPPILERILVSFPRTRVIGLLLFGLSEHVRAPRRGKDCDVSRWAHGYWFQDVSYYDAKRIGDMSVSSSKR